MKNPQEPILTIGSEFRGEKVVSITTDSVITDKNTYSFSEVEKSLFEKSNESN